MPDHRPGCVVTTAVALRAGPAGAMPGRVSNPIGLPVAPHGALPTARRRDRMTGALPVVDRLSAKPMGRLPTRFFAR